MMIRFEVIEEICIFFISLLLCRAVRTAFISLCIILTRFLKCICRFLCGGLGLMNVIGRFLNCRNHGLPGGSSRRTAFWIGLGLFVNRSRVQTLCTRLVCEWMLQANLPSFPSTFKPGPCHATHTRPNTSAQTSPTTSKTPPWT